MKCIYLTCVINCNLIKFSEEFSVCQVLVRQGMLLRDGCVSGQKWETWLAGEASETLIGVWVLESILGIFLVLFTLYK